MPTVAERALRHKTYGVAVVHYPVVGETLLSTLAQVAAQDCRSSDHGKRNFPTITVPIYVAAGAPFSLSRQVR